MTEPKSERPESQITTREGTKEELLARFDTGTKLTIVKDGKKGYRADRRSVILDDQQRLVLAQAEGKKGHSEPAELLFEDGDSITIEEGGERLAFTVSSADGQRSTTYVEGWIS